MSSNHQRVGGGRRKFAPGEQDTLIAEAEAMKRRGNNPPEIAEALEISVSSAKRWTKGVRRGRKAPVTKAGAIMSTDKKMEMRIDRERNLIDTSEQGEDPHRFIRVTTMPTEMESDYAPVRDNDDEHWVINPRLTNRALAVSATFTHDEATGRLLTVEDIEIFKSAYLIMHTLRIWNYDDFLTHREDWRISREMSEANLDEIATRVGLNNVTISRYETLARNPAPELRRKLHLAYTSLALERLHVTELILVTASWVDTFKEQAQRGEEVTEAHTWWANAPIEDITHLHSVRQYIPKPTFREDGPEMDGYWMPQLVTAT